MSDNQFPERLEQAIAHLTAEQQTELLERNPSAKGVKAAIAHVTGMPGPNVLSDILAGRVPGTKYRAALADATATDLAWLEGSADTPPDWALSPVAAWRRFARMLEDTAQRARYFKSSGQSTLPVPMGNDRDRIEVEMLARELDHDPRDTALLDLLKSRFTRPPMALLWRYAAYLGLAKPAQAAHLERGRELWQACEEEFATQLEQATAKFKRVLPPPALFRLMRAALVDMRQSRIYQGEDSQAVEDAMELLWLQQWFRLGRTRWDVPKAFVEETGRTAWSRLRDIQARHVSDADQDLEGRYRSRRPT